MGFIRKETIETMYRIDWGIHHLIGPLYLVKKYSPSTKGYRKFIWTLDVRKKER